MSTQRSVGIWSHVIRECHSTEIWLTANSAELCFFGHKHYLVWALYSLFEYRRRKSLFCHKSRNPSDLHCLSTVCPSPAMFPQHSYKTLLRVSAVMRKKSWSCKLRLKRAHLSLFLSDRLDQHQASSYEKKHLALTAWMIEVHSGYSQDTVWCSAPIGSCWRFLPGWCIFWAPYPSRSRDPWPPHRHWEREREREREREKEQMLIVIQKFMATLINWEETKEEQKWRGHVTRNPISLYESILFTSFTIDSFLPSPKTSHIDIKPQILLMKSILISETKRLQELMRRFSISHAERAFTQNS